VRGRSPILLKYFGISDKVQLWRADIRDAQRLLDVFKEIKPDAVFHFAAQAKVKPALEAAMETAEINVLGTIAVLEACRKVRATLYLNSTDKALGAQNGAEENARYEVRETYGASKAAAELFARAYEQLYKMPVVIIRHCNAYGLDLGPRIVPNTIRACLRGERPVIWRENKNYRRQYIYIEDLLDAYELLLENEVTSGVWHFGTPDVLTNEEVVRTVCEHFGVEPVYGERPKDRIHNIPSQWLDYRKAIFELGFSPKFSFKKGIKRTIEEFGRFYEKYPHLLR